ncbi:MAG: ABC transporter permease, partial [Reyranellales bacterium]
MQRYIVTRLLLAVPTLAGAAALVFILMRLIPGDVCVIRMGAGGAHVDQTAVDLCHSQLGLNDPMILQFLHFLWSYVTFDFGNSMWSGNPVAQEIALRLPVSLEVAVLATVIAILIAIPLGTISALKENTWLDHVVRVAAIAGIATPSFWLGIMSLILVLNVTAMATGKPWLPSIDYVP